VLKQTFILAAILTIPFLWIPFFPNHAKFHLNTGPNDPPKTEDNQVGDQEVEDVQIVPINTPDTPTSQKHAESQTNDDYLNDEITPKPSQR